MAGLAYAPLDRAPARSPDPASSEAPQVHAGPLTGRMSPARAAAAQAGGMGNAAVRDWIGGGTQGDDGWSLDGVVSGVTDSVAGAAEWASDTASSAWDGAVGFGGDLWSGAKDLGARAVEAGSGLLDSGVSWASDTATSAWDGARGFGEDLYDRLTSWHFEGRDARNGPPPSLEELELDRSWRQLGETESSYHQNEDGVQDFKYVNDEPAGMFGIGGKEAVIDGATGLPMETGPYQATYNYCNPAAGGIKDMSPTGILRNAGHLALDMVPYYLGGTVRGDEGTTFAQRVMGQEKYEAASEAWDGARGWVADTASGVGEGVSNGWNGLKDWAGGLR